MDLDLASLIEELLAVWLQAATCKVERIVDKRKNKKGKTEYLVRWKGYGSEDDTWEPEQHLENCEEYIRDFQRRHSERQREGALPRAPRTSPNSARKQVSRSTNSSFSKASPKPLVIGKDPESRSSALFAASQKFRKNTAPSLSTRKNMDLAKSGIKILVPKSPIKSRTTVDGFQSESPEKLDPVEQAQEDTRTLLFFPHWSVVLRRPEQGLCVAGAPRLLVLGCRALLTALAPHQLTAQARAGNPETQAALDVSSLAGTSPFMDALTANGTTSIQASVTGVTAGKRKFIDDRRDQPFDKRLRFSVRQTESAYRYRDIVVRKQDGFTHILLSTKSSENNSLNPEVMKEVQSALSTAAADDSKLVLLSAVGSVFCCGLDFIYFIRRLTDDRKRESTKMAEAIRNFVNTFIQFKKPIIVAVNGPAIGLGASILPLCDVVWANEKAWFQTPYTTFGQSPDGCSTVMFPKIMGGASANEMLLSGRKLTAQEACGKGLVSQVFWPGTFTQEVMVRIKELASCNPVRGLRAATLDTPVLKQQPLTYHWVEKCEAASSRSPPGHLGPDHAPASGRQHRGAPLPVEGNKESLREYTLSRCQLFPQRELTDANRVAASRRGPPADGAPVKALDSHSSRHPAGRC
ncbi:chromodomain protein, Y chromosome-like isoform a isoform 1-like protein [Camelus ferus]|nr:chromodomain protein, Y chromosome-like isoform a isoform 1-like protein [Camelus ferus]